MRSIAIVILTGALASGCMTVDTRRNPSYNGPPAYSGARLALANAGNAFLQLNPPLLAFFLADTLLSATADTLLLPITIPEQSAWNAARARAARSDLEQPSLIRPSKNESPDRSARRLFRLCSNLARNLSNKFTDCYSVDAKIKIREDGEIARTLEGPEYKDEIRSILSRIRGTGRFIRFVDPEYEIDGPNVRVRAMRLDSEDDERTPIELLIGPGEDDQWRILEETSVGWR